MRLDHLQGPQQCCCCHTAAPWGVHLPWQRLPHGGGVGRPQEATACRYSTQPEQDLHAASPKDIRVTMRRLMFGCVTAHVPTVPRMYAHRPAILRQAGLSSSPWGTWRLWSLLFWTPLPCRQTPLPCLQSFAGAEDAQPTIWLPRPGCGWLCLPVLNLAFCLLAPACSHSTPCSYRASSGQAANGLRL